LLPLLTSLADSLQPREAVVQFATPAPAPAASSELHFREFWDHAPTPDEADVPRAQKKQHHSFRSVAAHVLFPMTVVTSVFVGLMIWIG
jgi:hypothetical protein